MNGYSLVFIPTSWALGRWYKHKKTIYALGPFRYVVHRGLGSWMPAEPFEPGINKGVWLKGKSPTDYIGEGSRRIPAE